MIHPAQAWIMLHPAKPRRMWILAPAKLSSPEPPSHGDKAHFGPSVGNVVAFGVRAREWRTRWSHLATSVGCLTICSAPLVGNRDLSDFFCNQRGAGGCACLRRAWKSVTLTGDAFPPTNPSFTYPNRRWRDPHALSASSPSLSLFANAESINDVAYGSEAAWLSARRPPESHVSLKPSY